MKSRTQCQMPLHSLIVDADGSCRLCSKHETGIHALQPDTDKSILRHATMPSLKWHKLPWQDIWFGIDAAKIRSDQESGIWPERCTVCRQAELRGQDSLRQRSSNIFHNSTDHSGSMPSTLRMNCGESSDVRYLFGNSSHSRPLWQEREIASWIAHLPSDHDDHLNIPKWIGNRMLSSHYDLWCGITFAGATTMLVNPDVYLKQSSKGIDWADQAMSLQNMADLSSKIQRIEFAGGDAFCNESLVDTIDAISDSASVTIRTMLTRWPEKLLEAIARLRDCTVVVQIEGHHSVDEWIRYQTHWHVTTDLLDRLCQMQSIKIIIKTQITALNITNLPTLLSWLRDVSYRHQKLITWTPSINHTEFLHPCILPHADRMAIVQQLTAWRSDQPMQWPFYCWDGVDLVTNIISNRLRFDPVPVAKLTDLLNYQEKLRRNAVTRKWLGFGDDPDWQQVFPHMAALTEVPDSTDA